MQHIFLIIINLTTLWSVKVLCLVELYRTLQHFILLLLVDHSNQTTYLDAIKAYLHWCFSNWKVQLSLQNFSQIVKCQISTFFLSISKHQKNSYIRKKMFFSIKRKTYFEKQWKFPKYKYTIFLYRIQWKIISKYRVIFLV